ncbi:hypothetical protein R1flu_023111 [Riccia fluitans]|uniref:Uncharacterized protein n=1 Tax=Riccia fluitans TaxID=41844 RepID=A0ABD1XR40_9MARC
MGLLDKLWDDVLAGPQPEKGLSKLRQKQAVLPEGAEDEGQNMMNRRRSAEYQNREKEARRVTQSISIKKKPPTLQTTQDGSESPLPSPGGAASSPLASPATRERENIWRSVFHPGQNRALERFGSARFDNVASSPTSPTVYDWLYSGETKSQWRVPIGALWMVFAGAYEVGKRRSSSSRQILHAFLPVVTADDGTGRRGESDPRKLNRVTDCGQVLEHLQIFRRHANLPI